jgi:predicted RNA binding protein YcfA (HicA-like mRNA interferase family)
VTPRWKTLSGREVVRALTRLGFQVARTRGSHATLVRTTADGSRQVLTVPLHKELAPGTRQAIYRQSSKFVSADELRPFFFHD